MEKKFIWLFSAMLIAGSIGYLPVYAADEAVVSDDQASTGKMGSAVNPADGVVDVDIVHTNDIHGRSGYQAGKVFGFEKLAAYVMEISPDIVVDVGDLYHGQAFATLEKGESIAELVKTVGYDIVTPGNHDWNYGKERLKTLGALSDVVLLAGNIMENGENYFGNNGTYVEEIVDEDGDCARVGVLAVFDQDIKGDTAPSNIEGLEFENDAETATALARHLREEENCDIVIALSHQMQCEEFIRQTSGIDVLIAGHEHAAIDAQYTDAAGNLVKVVEAGKYFENVGHMTITYDTVNEAVTEITEKNVNVTEAANISSDVNVTKTLQAIQERLNGILSEVIGNTGSDLEGRWEEIRIDETGIGRLVTAAYLEETGADVAFENAGGIRIGRILPKGAITYQDILDIAPFGNYIVTKQITGKDILSILERSIDTGLSSKAAYDEWKETGSDQVRWPENSGSYLQFGGITAYYEPDEAAGKRVLSVKIGEKPLNPSAMYTIATNNFVALGEDYPELADAPEINQYSACDEALVRFVQKGQAAVDEAAGTIGLQMKEGEEPETEPTETEPTETEPTETEPTETEPTETESTETESTETESTETSSDETKPEESSNPNGSDGQTSGNSSHSNGDKETPKTGDDVDLKIPMVMLIFSMSTGMAAALKLKKRKS